MPAPVEDSNKAAFIERVRKALGRKYPLTSTPDHPSLKTTLPRHTEKVRTIQAKSEASPAYWICTWVVTESPRSTNRICSLIWFMAGLPRSRSSSKTFT